MLDLRSSFTMPFGTAGLWQDISGGPGERVRLGEYHHLEAFSADVVLAAGLVFTRSQLGTVGVRLLEEKMPRTSMPIGRLRLVFVTGGSGFTGGMVDAGLASSSLRDGTWQPPPRAVAVA